MSHRTNKHSWLYWCLLPVVLAGIAGAASAAATGLSAAGTAPPSDMARPSSLPVVLAWVLAVVGSTAFLWALGVLGAAGLIAAALIKMRTGRWPWPLNYLMPN